MASIVRESNLFAAEDWTKIYETFREIDFQSYDFQTIRKAMIDYLRTYYPEDFNDYIESSEYIALIDLIAYLTQSMSFRADLNARENFLETAERRDSILRLAKMLNYVPKRTQIARGLLKVQSITTTETVMDSDGNNLQDTEIFWNDITNPDFLAQFTAILNAAIVNTQRFGNPSLQTSINGIMTEEYEIAILADTVPVYEFSTAIAGRDFPFEIVKGTYSGTNYLYEVPPVPSESTNIIYRNDGRGFGSVNSGFFLYFKQGNLRTVDFTLDEKLPNRIVEIDTNNIDNNDVWLFSVGADGRETVQWTKLPAISGSNVIYNRLSNEISTLFAVNSRSDDQISLVFGDDVFAQSPVGDFRAYYRVGNGFSYQISPNEMQNIEISIPYISHSEQMETLTLRLALENTVSNAAARENLNDIKLKAQQQYYVQDRMVTGEDYQIFPLTNFNNIVKAKAVNRTTSGISRYLDVRDTTGKYSSTNIVAADGIFYRHEPLRSLEFDFTTASDISNVISRQIEPVMQNRESLHFYLRNYDFISLLNMDLIWKQTNRNMGYFQNSDDERVFVGDEGSGNFQFVRQGSLVRFLSPEGNMIWASVIKIDDEIVLSENIPDMSVAESVIAAWNPVLDTEIRNEIIRNILEFRTFGLRYDRILRKWRIIDILNLNQSETFSLIHADSDSNAGLDNSWFFLFINDGSSYEVRYRSTQYIFESVLETRFYFDSDLNVFDPTTGRTVKDQINILKVNNLPDSNEFLGRDYIMNIDDSVIESDGFTLSEKIKVTFPDSDNDGVVDNPEIFDIIVAPDVNSDEKIVFYRSALDENGYVRLNPVRDGVIETSFPDIISIRQALPSSEDDQVFYASSDGKFYQVGQNSSLNELDDYTVRTGRNNLMFRYVHNAPNNRRIDPSPSNIIDLYLLTSQYDSAYRNWITDLGGNVPRPDRLSGDSLRESFGSLENYKSVSDTIIFQSVNYRPLFGSKADIELQATFKIIKNQTTSVSDTEIKSRTVSAINDYFALENWDFGDTFYFSELDAYLYQTLAPDILSVVIVPKYSSSAFGSLFQIQSLRDEIFISAATVDDIDIIDSITAVELRSGGEIVNVAEQPSLIESASANPESGNTELETVINNIDSDIVSLRGYEY